MRLVSFSSGSELRLGALTGSGVVDLAAASDGRLPSSMLAFLEAGPQALEEARCVVANAKTAIPLETVRLGPCIPNPRKIICVGLNYTDHAIEVGKEPPTIPVLFTRFATTLVGPEDPVEKPAVTECWDYEAELAVIIGCRCRRVPKATAMNCVAGYAVANDITARDYQHRTSQWTPGKNFDRSCPLGPALVTADEVPDPHNLAIRFRIGGTVFQDSSTAHMIFRIPYLIAYITEFLTLEPGDVVLTGTPAGVGFARKPPRYLQPGDVMETWIEGIGTLRNRIVAEQTA